MPWIQSHTELVNHPKLLDLAAEFEWSKDEAIGRLHRLWWWCIQYHEDGVLEGVKPSQIALALELHHTQGEKFVRVLIVCRFLDEKPLRIHDWWDYAGRAIQMRYHTWNPAKIEAIKRIYGVETAVTKPIDNLQEIEDFLSTSGSVLKNKISKSSSKRTTTSAPQKTAIPKGQPKGIPKDNLPVEQRVERLKVTFAEPAFRESLTSAYPNVDLVKEQRKMEVWIISTPKKSNKKEWRRFINNWCARAQKQAEEKGHGRRVETHVEGDRKAAYQKATKQVELS